MAEKIIGKGYYTGGDFMGWIPEKKTYQKFSSEEEYWNDYIRPKLDEAEEKEDNK